MRNKELVSSSVSTFFLKLFSFGSLYLINFLIAKNYGPSELGAFSLFNVLYNLILIIGLLGLDTALLRFVPQYNKNKNLKFILRKSMIIAGVWSLIVALFLLPASSFFIEEKYFRFVYLFILIVPLIILSKYYSVVLRGFNKVALSILFDNVMQRLLLLLLLLGMMFYEISLANITILCMIIAVAISAFIIIPVGFKITKNNIEGNIPEVDTQSEFTFKRILSTSLPMLLTSSMLYIAGWTDTIMIAFFMDNAAVGVYNVCLQISFITNFAYIIINTIITPKFSELYWNKKMLELKGIVQNSAKFTFWSSVPVIIGIIIFSKPLLSLYGSDFNEAYTVLIILCFSQMIRASVGLVFQLLDMSGYERINNKIMLFTLFINIILNALLIPISGLLGAAIATFISNAIRNILSSYYAYKNLSFRTWYIPFLNSKKNKVL